MSVIVDELHMFNRAAVRAGVGAIQSFDADLPGHEAPALIYQGVTEFLLGCYPFYFTFGWQQLARIDRTPFSGFDYVFRLPGDRLEAPKQYSDDLTARDRCFTDLVVTGDEVHAQTDTLFARTQTLVAPVVWSATFREAHTLYMASVLAGAMPGDDKKAELLRRDAVGTPQENFRGGALGVAIRADARNTPPRRLDESGNPFLAAWHSGAG